jgi:hypothetical protein
MVTHELHAYCKQQSWHILPWNTCLGSSTKWPSLWARLVFPGPRATLTCFTPLSPNPTVRALFPLPPAAIAPFLTPSSGNRRPSPAPAVPCLPPPPASSLQARALAAPSGRVGVASRRTRRPPAWPPPLLLAPLPRLRGAGAAMIHPPGGPSAPGSSFLLSAKAPFLNCEFVTRRLRSLVNMYSMMLENSRAS